MSMRRRGFLAGVIGGLLLGLAVVASGPTANGPLVENLGLSFSMASKGTSASTIESFSTTMTSTSPGSDYSVSPSGHMQSNSSGASASVLNADSTNLDSLRAQPIAITGVVLLPILVAFLFGLVFYQVSRDRRE